MKTAVKTRNSSFRYIDREFVPPTREQRLERVYRSMFPLDATFHTSWIGAKMTTLCQLIQSGDTEAVAEFKAEFKALLSPIEVEAIAHVTGIEL